MNPYQPPDADESQLDRIERRFELHHGDCLDVLKTLADCSVDAIVTDPPYGLGKEPDPVKVMAAWILQGYFEVEGSGFMGKKWDAFVPQPIIWKEVFRVLKPGGHLLAFAGTRTQDWMAMSLRFAGFEIRDMIAWVYGSGMPKSFNLKRSGVCDCVPAENALPYTYEQNTKHNVRPLQNGDLQEAGSYGKERGQILLPILPKQGEHSDRQAREKPQASDGKQPSMEGREVYRAEERVCDDSPTGSLPSQTERLRTGAYLGSGKDVREAAGGKRGGSPQEQEQSGQPTGKPASVLKPLGTLDEGALHGCGQCQRCGKIKKNLEGFGTTLKPALEPITLARKPPIGTIAANVLEHGTGGLNIGACRVGTEGATKRSHQEPYGEGGRGDQGGSQNWRTGHKIEDINTGRWPANFIHDNSEEVLALFPDSDGSGSARTLNRGQRDDGWGMADEPGLLRDAGTGSAARFFYCAKASRDDRDEGCGALDERRCGSMQATQDGSMLTGSGNERTTQRRNTHSTVKPTDLMRYLCRLITPPNGIVLDPFTGSGSTGKAAMAEGFRFIGIEREAEYIEIARARISAEAQKPRQLSLF
jgi:DNA modification methylase